MAKSNRQTESYQAGKLREHLKDRNRNELDILQETGLLSQDAIAFLTRFKQNYSPRENEPRKPEETSLYQNIVQEEAAKNVRQAVKESNISEISHAVGIYDEAKDVSFELKFKNWITQTAPLIYIIGEPGNGKTDFALFLAEIWEKETDGELASNIRSCPETKTIENQWNLEEWLSKDTEKLFIFDEASSHATGYNKDRKNVEENMSQLVKQIRKEKAGIIIIGHTGKDLHPDIRRLCEFVHKKDTKYAEIYERVRDGQGEDLKFELKNIPPTSLEFDTYEESSWSW